MEVSGPLGKRLTALSTVKDIISTVCAKLRASFAALQRKQQVTILNIPPEIRETIYFHVCQGMEVSSRAAPILSRRPIEPPLTQVCRLVREESLPVFYSTYCLIVTIYVELAAPSGTQVSHDSWYHRLDPEKLRHVRHFKLRYWAIEPEATLLLAQALQYDPKFDGRMLLEVNITLDRREGSYSINSIPGHAFFYLCHENDPQAGRMSTIITKYLVHRLDSLVESLSSRNLTAYDLDRLLDGRDLVI